MAWAAKNGLRFMGWRFGQGDGVMEGGFTTPHRFEAAFKGVVS